MVPELGEPRSVEALAKHLITARGGPTGRAATIVFTQLRSGDKMCEALLSQQGIICCSRQEPRPVKGRPQPRSGSCSIG